MQPVRKILFRQMVGDTRLSVILILERTVSVEEKYKWDLAGTNGCRKPSNLFDKKQMFLGICFHLDYAKI